MMNIRNLGSKESVGVWYNDGICAKLCLKIWFESYCYFCNIIESGWFWKWLSRSKVPNNHFLSQFRSSGMQMFFKIGVLKNLCRSLFLIRHLNANVFLWILQIFYEKLFLRNTSGGCFCQFDKVKLSSH